MVSFLLIISFLLHLAALGAIYKLFQQIQTLKSQDTKEIEGLFEAYLQEIKEENSRLQAQLKANQKNKSSITAKKQQGPEQESQPAHWLEGDMEQLLSPVEADTLEASLESKVLQMHSEGLAIGDIARNLDCGKTEVEIILKLHKKNN
ncbi:DUF6115 domain-containing protein [Oceanobacillus sp. CF4.6]|uniref:DUF6115 domain-containing protein n=1 Tax=Oceanobacillus sp. CF4.6 TaxID=3373080 RepID=UPI003EE79020